MHSEIPIAISDFLNRSKTPQSLLYEVEYKLINNNDTVLLLMLYCINTLVLFILCILCIV